MYCLNNRSSIGKKRATFSRAGLCQVPSRSRSLFLGAPSDAMAQRAELLRSVVPGLQGLEAESL